LASQNLINTICVDWLANVDKSAPQAAAAVVSAGMVGDVKEMGEESAVGAARGRKRQGSIS